MKLRIENYTIKLKEDKNVWMPTRFGIALAEILANGQGPKPNAKVLELGVGSGILSIICGVIGARKVVGLDINPAALRLTFANWQRNGLPKEKLELRLSDLFSGLDPRWRKSFDLLISNPPTFPKIPKDRWQRSSREEWEFAGKEGREVLDALLTQGHLWLKPGGKMVTIATSKQGWEKTKRLLETFWHSWEIIKVEDLPLAKHYAPYLKIWQKKQREDGEPRIYQKDGRWFQRLYFIKAIAS